MQNINFSTRFPNRVQISLRYSDIDHIQYEYLKYYSYKK